jgi:NADH-quinone oxidoreductase subunit L
MFHLMTHAFFKALLFLAGGIVIHALAGEQDMRKMGGLRRLLPRTYWVFVVGALALVGIPPFSGFFSKDAVLASALARGGWYGDLLWAVGLTGAFLTGIYTFRMLFMAFWGEPSAFVREHLTAGSHAHDREGHTDHGDHGSHMHAGEGPFSMTSTVAVLAVLAAFGGWIQVADLWTPITNWLEPVAPSLVDATGLQDVETSVAAVLVGLAGVGVAWWIYAEHRAKAPRPLALLEHKFYFDELYDALFYRPAVLLATGLARWVERPLISGSVRELAAGVRDLGLGTRRLQTGLVRTYTLAIAASLAIVTVVFVVVR